MFDENGKEMTAAEMQEYIRFCERCTSKDNLEHCKICSVDTSPSMFTERSTDTIECPTCEGKVGFTGKTYTKHFPHYECEPCNGTGRVPKPMDIILMRTKTCTWFQPIAGLGFVKECVKGNKSCENCDIYKPQYESERTAYAKEQKEKAEPKPQENK